MKISQQPLFKRCPRTNTLTAGSLRSNNVLTHCCLFLWQGDDDDDAPLPLISEEEERLPFHPWYLYLLCQVYVGPYDADYEIHSGMHPRQPIFDMDWGAAHYHAFAK